MNSTIARRSLLAVLSLFATSAFADSVKGEFALEGKPSVKPVEVLAFRSDNKTVVMLTAKPLDRERIAHSSDPESTAVNDKAAMDTDYLELFVDASGVVSLNAHVGGPGSQYLDSTKWDLVANCAANTSEHVACTVKTKELVKVANEPGWTMDITFDSAVLANTAK